MDIERWQFKVDDMSDCKCDCEPDEFGTFIMYKDHTATIKALQEENEKLTGSIQEMVTKAAAKHRPAYDEQQRRIMAYQDRVKELEAACAALKRALDEDRTMDTDYIGELLANKQEG